MNISLTLLGFCHNRPRPGPSLCVAKHIQDPSLHHCGPSEGDDRHMGSTIAMFSVQEAALGRGFPFPEPERLVLGRASMVPNPAQMAAFPSGQPYAGWLPFPDWIGGPERVPRSGRSLLLDLWFGLYHSCPQGGSGGSRGSIPGRVGVGDIRLSGGGMTHDVLEITWSWGEQRSCRKCTKNGGTFHETHYTGSARPGSYLLRPG